MPVKLSVYVWGIPDYPLSQYIVARVNEDTGELWYWGTWEDKDAALEIVARLDRAVLLERE